MATTRCFLRVEPVWRYTYGSDDPRLQEIKVTGCTQKRPRVAQNGCVVELSLSIPDGAFMPLRPTVTIEVPAEALNYEPTVTVELPANEDTP